ncbi:poly(A)-specific ribonuclease PARN-like isoform X2 [Clavelina lepadiformis]|uniref:poly(A)-specific ribonuclease PARN-like isoform X2 n=1 Tax=Clavelina lepadiformis TaxID=159417 RepID=UPI004041E269
MDVTRDNFKEVLPIVTEAINAASFICIDGEFTGLSNGTYNVTAYDSPEDRYFKIHCNTENFLLLQFGMCTFCWNEELQKYKIQAFNFYIFPFRSSMQGVPDRIFSCQSSSLDFLTAQGFDFNKAFKKGIPFLHQNEESNVRSALEEKQVFRENAYKSPGSFHNPRNSSSFQSPMTKGSPTPITDQKTKDFTDGVIKQVQVFLEEETSDELVLEPCNSYLRKILFETLPRVFPDKILVEGRTDEQTYQRHIVVVRGASESIKKAREQLAREREEQELQDAIGFSVVIKLLSECQKLIVGHNMLLDLIYTIRQFFCPLPPCLEDFKSLVQCVFPNLLDTKLMGSMLPFKDLLTTTALGEMNTRLREAPFKPSDVDIPGKYNVATAETQNENLHEAAYDAFITGTAFLSMVNHLSSYQNSSKPNHVTSFTSLQNLTSPYINKIFLMRSHDIPYLNLAGADLTPSRDHVFYIEFPSSWKASDLRQLFSPLGQISISWINDIACFVGLYNKGQAKHVKSLMKSDAAEPCLFRITTYNEYKADSVSGFYSTHSQHRIWTKQNVHNNITASSGSTIPLSHSLSFTSGLQAASITGHSDVPASSNRKRSSTKEDNDFANSKKFFGEPKLKKQKSQEECAYDIENCNIEVVTNSPLHKADESKKESPNNLANLLSDSSFSENMKSKNSSTSDAPMFEVPNEW